MNHGAVAAAHFLGQLLAAVSEREPHMRLDVRARGDLKFDQGPLLLAFGAVNLLFDQGSNIAVVDVLLFVGQPLESLEDVLQLLGRQMKTQRASSIGQGGSAAAHDLPNGISIRLEAPEDWRVKEVAFREGLSHTKAKLRILEVQRERDYLRKLYSSRFHSKPSFALVYDCSTFTLAQIAQHVVYAMKLKGII